MVFGEIFTTENLDCDEIVCNQAREIEFSHFVNDLSSED